NAAAVAEADFYLIRGLGRLLLRLGLLLIFIILRDTCADPKKRQRYKEGTKTRHGGSPEHKIGCGTSRFIVNRPRAVVNSVMGKAGFFRRHCGGAARTRTRWSWRRRGSGPCPGD